MNRITIHWAILLIACFVAPAAAAETRPAKPTTRPTQDTAGSATATTIEVDRPSKQMLSGRGGLGTTGYRVTEREKPFVAKTPDDELTNGSILDDQPYELAARKGKRVAWFGIVRSITPQPDGTVRLAMEHKYFDGLTDLHILALSFNGGGDFVARLAAKEPPIKPLMLVRVYGQVVQDETPTVLVEYARVFPWGTFTFLECYGKDTSNPAWRALCKVPLDRIYKPYPDETYYRDRLGEPPADK